MRRLDEGKVYLPDQRGGLGMVEFLSGKEI